MGLDFFVVIEKLVNFCFVASEDSFALVSKLSLNLDQLFCVLSSHLLKLRLHTGDKTIDIFGHLLDCLDVVAIFLIDLLLKFLDQLLLVTDNFGAGGFLSLNVLRNSNKAVITTNFQKSVTLFKRQCML